jgi:hypothetical protein
LCQHLCHQVAIAARQEASMAMEFKTDAVFDALKSPLGLVEDQEKRQAFERYVEAARYPLERAVFDLLSALVTAVGERVQDRYRLRLAYAPGALTLDVETVAQPEEPAGDVPEWTSAGDGETEKITIRIPAELKNLATQAASSAGLSANSWFVRALARSLRAMDEGPRARGPFPPEPPEPPRPPHSGQHQRQGKKLQGWYGGDAG